MTRAEAHIKKASDAFLLHRWQEGVNELGEAQHSINAVAAWLVMREHLEERR